MGNAVRLWGMVRRRFWEPYAGLPREIYILFAARIVSCLGGFIAPLLTLILTRKLGYSASEAGSFSALLILTQAPSVILGGKLADRIGRKKLLVFCQLLGSAFYLFCGIVREGSLMLPFIVLASDLYTAAMPACQAMAADYSTAENRRASFSLIYLGINIGMTVSPFFAGLLFQRHLPLLFLLDALTTLAATLMIAFFVKEADWRNAPRKGAEPSAPDGASVFWVLWHLPVLLLVILLQFTYHFTYSQWSFLLPLQLGDFFGDGGAVDYSVMTALNSLIVVLFTPLLTGLTLHRRPLRVISLGGALFGASYVLYGFSRAMPLFLLGGTIFTLGEIVSTIHTDSFVADHTPEQYLGRVNSFTLFVRGSGNALGPLLVGDVVETAGYRLTWLMLAAFVLLGAAGILLLNGKDKRLPESGAESGEAEGA